jgi:hypothetical protein
VTEVSWNALVFVVIRVSKAHAQATVPLVNTSIFRRKPMALHHLPRAVTVRTWRRASLISARHVPVVIRAMAALRPVVATRRAKITSITSLLTTSWAPAPLILRSSTRASSRTCKSTNWTRISR